MNADRPTARATLLLASTSPRRRDLLRKAGIDFQIEGARAEELTGGHWTARELCLFNAERKAFGALGLEAGAERAEIKARFKTLVKRHHPDANGGDRGSEDTLREIIQAYNYLKTAGFC